MTCNFSSVTTAVSRSALNADIDGISVTKHFGWSNMQEDYCDRIRAAYIFYTSICGTINRIYFSNMTSDDDNYHSTLCRTTLRSPWISIIFTRIWNVNNGRRKLIPIFIIFMNQDNNFISQHKSIKLHSMEKDEIMEFEITVMELLFLNLKLLKRSIHCLKKNVKI